MGGYRRYARRLLVIARVRLATLATLTSGVVAAVALLAASSPASTRQASAAASQVPVFLRVSNLKPGQTVELSFDTASVQMVGLKVNASPGIAAVQLLNNDFSIQSDSDTLMNADVSFSAENVGAMITGTAKVPGGVQVTALGEPTTTITSGKFSFPPEFRSALPQSRVVDSPARVEAGKSVAVHGRVEDCAPGNRVAVTSRAFSGAHRFDGLPALFPTVRDATFSARTKIPASDRAGVYTVSARCGKRVLASVRLTVTAS